MIPLFYITENPLPFLHIKQFKILTISCHPEVTKVDNYKQNQKPQFISGRLRFLFLFHNPI